jgi:hypothetical protein
MLATRILSWMGPVSADNQLIFFPLKAYFTFHAADYFTSVWLVFLITQKVEHPT